MNSRTPRTQTERSAATRKALLEATITVLLENGYNGCSLTKVARMAGLTTGSVQHHFDTKADLMLAVIEERIFEIGNLSDKQIGPELSIARRCEKVVESQWGYYRDPSYLAIWTIILGGRSDPELTLRISDWQKNAIDLHEEAIGMIFSDLHLKPKRIKSIQYAVNAQLRGLALLQAVDPRPLVVKQQLELFVDMLRRHLCCESGTLK